MKHLRRFVWRLWLGTDDPDKWPNSYLEDICPLNAREVYEFYDRWARKKQCPFRVTSGDELQMSVFYTLAVVLGTAVSMTVSLNPCLLSVCWALLVLCFLIWRQEHVAWNSHFAMVRAIEEYSKGIGRRKKSIARGIRRDIKLLEKARARVARAEARLAMSKAKDAAIAELYSRRRMDAASLQLEIDSLIEELQHQLDDSDHAVAVVRANFAEALRRLGPGDVGQVLDSARETLTTVGATPAFAPEIKSLASDAGEVHRLLTQLNARYRIVQLEEFSIEDRTRFINSSNPTD